MVNKIILNLRNAGRDTDIEFPCTEKEMSEALEKIEIPDLNAPKIYVSEVVEPSGLSMLEGKALNLDEVNYLAKLLDSLVQDERDKIYAVANYEGYDTPKELINVYFNSDSYTLVQDLKSIEQVGRQHYITIKGGMTTDEAQKTDFAKIGKELLFSRQGVFTDYGLLFRNEGIEFREIYDGQVFPQYSYYGNELFTVEMVYNGKREYLYLAEETRSIDKALARLGAKDYSDCKLQICDFNIESKIWLERFKAMLNKESIYAVNEAVQAVNVAGIDLEKLDALVRYVEDDSADTVERLAEHIDDFKYIYYAEDYETMAYSPVTYGHLCYYVNGMLSMPGGIDGLFNIFEVDTDTMRYDLEAMVADIEQYGLYTYEELSVLVPVTEKMFEAVNAQYLKVAVGKGMITVEQIGELIEKYGDMFE